MSRFFIFVLFTSSVGSQASRQFSFKTGASVTIPCRYDRTYIQHKKYWCFDASAAYNYCKIQAYANETQGKVTVTDNPAESLFTVTMNNLQTENTGMYWCVVEIGGIFNPDVTEQLYITVKSDPDLYVMESRVSGEEGGSVTVQCNYSAAYQNKQKQWCRFIDSRCNNTGRTATSQNSAVQVNDDGRRSFSVQMSGLKKSDAGWYWCSAGDLQVPVHISVGDPPPDVTAGLTTTTHHVSIYTSGSKHSSATSVTSVTSVSRGHDTIEHETLIYWYLVAVILLLVILVIIVCVLRRKYTENQVRTRDRSNDSTVHTAESEGSYSSIAFKSRKKKSEQRNLEQRTFTAEDSVIYSSVAVSKPKSSASTDNEQDVNYSFVKIAPKNKTKSPKDVGDETIYSSVVCYNICDQRHISF